jgi:hypothetical protein
MRIAITFLLFFVFSFSGLAQNVKRDSIVAKETDLDESDSIPETILLDEVVVSNHKLDYESRKEFLILQNRVYKVYPYAKVAAERLSLLDKNMSKLKSNKEKKKYFKIVEDYIENEFTDQLKKLSRKQGQILVKLIYRQTGRTTFDLIKDYKSGWKAFWSNNTAKVFDIDIKSKYAPYDVNEDYLIETILVRAFESGRLPKQQAATPIDINDLDTFWINKATQQAEVKK